MVLRYWRVIIYHLLIYLYQQKSRWLQSLRVEKANEAIPLLQSVKPDARPCSQFVPAELIILDFEPA
jgi:hypothetical protein